MKKIVIATFAAAFLIACNLQNGREKDPASPTHEEHSGHTSLELNNGAKWKADTATKINVALLKAVVPTGKTDYQESADQLQLGLNKMIAECKMQGPDHDALHKWLEPLIEKVKTLKNETNAEKAAEVLKEIQEQLNLFSQYFE